MREEEEEIRTYGIIINYRPDRAASLLNAQEEKDGERTWEVEGEDGKEEKK
jgi:hypothetical protein